MTISQKNRTALSLRATLTIAFLAIGIITPLFSGGLLLFSQIKMQRTVIYGSQHLIAREAAGNVVEYIESKFRTLDTALWLTDIDNISSESMELLLKSLLGFERSYANIAYLDARGNPKASVSRLPSISSDNFIASLDDNVKSYIQNGKRSISSVYINPSSGEPMIVLAVPAFNVFGDYTGCMIAEVNLKYIWDLVGSLKVGKNGLAYVVNEKGDLIAFKDTARVLKGENMAELEPVHDFITAAGADRTGEVRTYRGIDGTLVVGTYVPLGTPDWAVVTETPLAEAYRVVIANVLTTLMITLVVAFAAGIMGIYLARWISVPLSHLTQTAARIASGDRTLRAVVERPKEAASLADAFNSMTSQLRQILENLEQQVIDTGKAESALRRVNETLQGVIDNSPLAIVMLDIEKGVMLWNSAAETMYGWSAAEIIGKQLPLFNGESNSEFSALRERVMRGEVLTGLETEHHRKDGSAISVSASLSPVRGSGGEIYALMIIAADITERKLADEEKKRLESQLVQAQKMESIGRLAGGVAHDINNMLSVILGYSELIKSQLDTDSPLFPHISNIEKAGLHSRDITRQLLAFSRKQLIDPKQVNLNEIIADTTSTLSRLMGEDIELSFVPEKDLWRVKLDPAQISQILVNLAANARDAMPMGGRLIIKTGNLVIDESYPRQHYEIKTGPHVMLEVSDTGTGMDGETAAHIFEPFFTTKETGKGTGLGLATVYGIAKQNSGFISLYSEPGQGTTFRIYFPSSEETDSQKGEERTAGPVPGAGKILLVEDDAMVRELTAKMLEKIGYTVTIAGTPAEALNICENAAAHFDLLITDVIMPQMSGSELRDKIRAVRRDMKVLFISGYTSDIIAHHGVLEKGVQLLQKPFGLADLAQKISQIIENGQAPVG